MRRFHFSYFGCVFASMLWALGQDKASSMSNRQVLNSFVIGRLSEGVIRYESLKNAEIIRRYRIDAEVYEDVCRTGSCEASWSTRGPLSWVAIRNILSNRVIVADQYGKVRWTGVIAFEPMSMLSVDKDGNTLALIGRVNGASSVWFITKSGSRVAFALPTVERSDRLQIEWGDADGVIYLSDGKWVLQCGGNSHHSCERLVEGRLPSLSPDGTMLAFFSGDRALDIYSIKVARTVFKLETKIGWGAASPKWSSDSDHLILDEATTKGSRLTIVEISSRKVKSARQTNDKSIAQMGLVRLSASESQLKK